MDITQIVKPGTHATLDIFGPTIEFLVPPKDEAGYCVMLGTLPPHGTVPLHSHPDAESFYLLSGAVDVLRESDGGLEWLPVRRGQFVQVLGGKKHAFRNSTNEPVVQLIITTPQLGKFFQEVGRPAGVAMPPAPADLQHFAKTAAKYGHWLGTPAENKAVGIAI